MKTVLKVLGAVAVLLIVAVVGVYLWASWASDRSLSRSVETHTVDFPIPFPLSPEERVELNLSADEAERVAVQRALERGAHLVEARYGCTECHGENFGGGVMVDAFPIGTLLGPNLTTGRGTRTLGYTATDWDRIVRHGIQPDGSPSAMPSQDFQRMSDRELSDIIVYIRSLRAVDNEVPSVTLGPLGKVLVATGGIPLSADLIDSHTDPHPVEPPPAEPTAEFGRHLAGTCMGCHGEDLSGGPIPGGDPAWVAASNLTPHPTALGDWTYDDFVAAMREGRRPDGSALREPMASVVPYGQRMTDIELEAMWHYLRSVPEVSAEGAEE